MESRPYRTGALRGLGETRVPMIANLVGYWAMGLPLGFILCFVLKWGIYGMWIGLTVSLIVIATACAATVASGFRAGGAGAFKNIGLATDSLLDRCPERGADHSIRVAFVRDMNTHCCERYLRCKSGVPASGTGNLDGDYNHK